LAVLYNVSMFSIGCQVMIPVQDPKTKLLLGAIASITFFLSRYNKLTD